MPKYIHTFDLWATITTDYDDFDDINPEDLREAMLTRINSLKPEELRDAFGHIETDETP